MKIMLLVLAFAATVEAQVVPSFAVMPVYTFGWPFGNAIVLPAEVDPTRLGKEIVAMVPDGKGMFAVHALIPVTVPNTKPWPASYVSAALSSGGTQWFCVEQPSLIAISNASLFVVDINGDGLDDVFVFSPASATSLLGTGKRYC